MTIVDNEIQDLVNKKGLIVLFESKNLINCRYNLRAGKAFLPKTGEELETGSVGGWRQFKKRDHWVVEPSETLVIMTTEKIKIPPNMYATYSQLNRLARKGLMLVNVSIIEPGYEGPLSCFLVNFSKDSVTLYPNDDVAKICFHTLSKVPDDPQKVTLGQNSYKRKLIESAKSYPKSFMDIGGIEERIVDRATKNVRRSITIGGIFIAILVLWNTLEPLTNKFIWQSLGVSTKTHQAELMQIQHNLESAKKDLSIASAELKHEEKINELEKEMEKMQELINKR